MFKTITTILIIISLSCIAIMDDNDKKEMMSSIDSFRNNTHETILNKLK